MKKIIFVILMMVSFSLTADPNLESDPATDLEPGAVFQLMINDIEQPTLYSVVNNAVNLDVQNYEGQKTIKIRYGNPWPELANTYKWSDWSDPFVYNFPVKPGKPTGCSIK